MHAQRIDNMFNFTYEVSAAQIVAAAKVKAIAIRDKMKERALRCDQIREEYKISDAALVDILAQARQELKRGGVALVFTSKVPSNDGLREEDFQIGAGVVNMLLTERDHIEIERSQVEKLDMIVRNLKDRRYFAPDGKEYVQGYDLHVDELKFLGL